MILLARHGETEWNREERYQGHADPPLNETGRAQARAACGALAGELDRRRLLERSAPRLGHGRDRGRAHRPPRRARAGLREIDVGSWQGLTKAQIDGRPWDGETYEHHSERVTRALREIAARHPDGRVLVVSHGGSLRRVQAAVLGEPLPVVEHCTVWTCYLENGELLTNP